MSIVVEYSIITKADSIIKDSLGFYATNDSYQQQAQYNNGGTDPTVGVKRLDFLLKPTSFSNPSANRIVDIDLSAMKVDYIRILHAKCDKYFLMSTSDTAAGLNTAPRELTTVLFKDFGVAPPTQSTFTPDVPYPKFIRLMNPIELNGGGSGNDNSDTPIMVSLHLVTNKFNA